MNVDDLISRATHTSGRALLAVAVAVILSKLFNHPLEKFPVLVTAKEMPAGMINVAASGLLIFLFVIHIINWWNDWLGDKASAIVEISSREREYEEGGYVVDNSAGKSYEKLELEYQGMIKATSKAQWLSLYIQHLTAPLGFGFIAIMFSGIKIVV